MNIINTLLYLTIGLILAICKRYKAKKRTNTLLLMYYICGWPFEFAVMALLLVGEAEL